ncbi:MAG: hypothetical protein KAW49_10045, partial [Anaerolineae bacterium]|nr:hypothetical protein [Anaerolineae bacterium]
MNSSQHRRKPGRGTRRHPQTGEDAGNEAAESGPRNASVVLPDLNEELTLYAAGHARVAGL